VCLLCSPAQHSTAQHSTHLQVLHARLSQLSCSHGSLIKQQQRALWGLQAPPEQPPSGSVLLRVPAPRVEGRQAQQQVRHVGQQARQRGGDAGHKAGAGCAITRWWRRAVAQVERQQTHGSVLVTPHHLQSVTE
jgi:hypothetical protein